MSKLFGWIKGPKANSSDSSLPKRKSTPSKPASVNTDGLPEDQLIIAVIGWTGAGKSLFISKATGADIPIGHGLELCTKKIDIIKVRSTRCDRDVVFVDTPGFDDINTDVEILEMLGGWLNKRYQNKVTLAGLLYLHRISDNRMLGTPLKNLRKFKELCGKDGLQKIILVTTMWGEVDEETGSRREEELRERYWKTMITQGSRTARFEGTLDSESAWHILDPFIRPRV